MSHPRVSVLITDLDNTLFDWVDIWYRSFSAMLEKLIEISGVDRESLLNEIKEVHQKHGTSEYAFLIEEVPCLGTPSSESAKEKYDEAIKEFTLERKKAQVLFEGVSSTLRELKNRGVKVVGYTESMEFYACRRVRELGLDGLIDVLYTSPDHALPDGMSAEQIRSYPSSHYEFRFTEHRQTPKGELKPNPMLLLDIIRDIGAKPEECVYLGDSPFKDIVMAQQAGVLDIFAEYGEAHRREEYELLRRVTHWPRGDVQREKEQRVVPSLTIKSFGQILDVVAFVKFVPQKADNDDDIKIWSTIVGTQQHFNDLCLRIRNFAVTVLGAVLGVSGLAIRQNMYILLFGHQIHVSVFLIMASLVAWLSFFFMDKYWYHRLLLGAVAQGMEMEKRISKRIPEMSLGHKIKEFSTVKLFGISLNSSRKIIVFYSIGAIAHIVFAMALLFSDSASQQPGFEAPAQSSSAQIKYPPASDAQPAAVRENSGDVAQPGVSSSVAPSPASDAQPAAVRENSGAVAQPGVSSSVVPSPASGAQRANTLSKPE